MNKEFKKVILLSDYGSMDLTKKVHEYLDKKEIPGGLHSFKPDALPINRFGSSGEYGEIDLDIKTSMRGRDVFVFKSCMTLSDPWDDEPSLDNLVYHPRDAHQEMTLINDALIRAQASHITNVMLHQPYQRQDRRAVRTSKKDNRKRRTRSPVSVRLMADQLQDSGAQHIVTLDPHFKQLEVAYRIPVDILNSNILFAYELKKIFGFANENIMIMGPDESSFSHVKELADIGNWYPGLVFKKRSRPGCRPVPAGVMSPENVSLEGKTIILKDDMIDSAGTIENAVQLLRSKGAKDFYVAAAHSILSGEAVERLNRNDITLLTTNSINNPKIKQLKKSKVIDLYLIIAESILSLVSGETLGGRVLDYGWYEKKCKDNFL